MLAFFLWLPVAYFLHVVIHEGSHALAASLYGLRVTRLDVLPDYQNGRWTFGRTMLEARPAGSAMVAFSIAPAVVAIPWALAMAGLVRVASPWAQGILWAEVLAALVDLSVWCLTAWTRRGDAFEMEAEVMPEYSARWFSLAVPVTAGGSLLLSGLLG